ncbi:hypothetical protein C8Q76DRAFT_204016 [Earliella scabrosa]|nr:hypothetical protein C8Q76DRAFT_204016 [Earliella scabrosa]
MTVTTISPFDAATRLLVFFILMTVLPPLLGWFIGRQLPSYRIRGLQAALHDVEGLYYYCLESGFMNEVPAIEFQARLSRLRVAADALSLRVSQAVSVADDFKNLARGYSLQISRLHREVNVLRADIAVGLGGLEAQQRLPQYCDFDVKLQVSDNDNGQVASAATEGVASA